MTVSIYNNKKEIFGAYIMNKKIILSCFCILALTSCAVKTFIKPPINNKSDDASIKLAEAASSISDSMMEVAKVEKVITPPSRDNTLTISNAPGLEAHASVDWSGPVDELVMRIANSARYKTRVIGQAPAIPVLVSVRSEDKTLAEILRDIDYQAGQKAEIHVYANSRIVELRYAKATS
jgi:defect-in-organelle-trafficking protein DotD